MSLLNGKLELSGESLDTFRVEFSRQGGGLTIGFFGEFDIGAVETLPAWSQIEGEREVVADLSGLSFMDSSGLHALLRLKQHVESGGGNFYLRCPIESPVMRLLEMTGVKDRFTQTLPPDDVRMTSE